jgi:hypothetical protein
LIPAPAAGRQFFRVERGDGVLVAVAEAIENFASRAVSVNRVFARQGVDVFADGLHIDGKLTGQFLP